MARVFVTRDDPTAVLFVEVFTDVDGKDTAECSECKQVAHGAYSTDDLIELAKQHVDQPHRD